MKEIREELTYAAAPSEVFDLISTGAFQLELIAHLGGRNGELIEETRNADGSVKVVTRQQTAVELPGFAKRLIPANTTVTQTYDWEAPDGDGNRRGRWSADAKGAPVSIGGPTELKANGNGTVHIYLGQVKASVPVVGGRLEGFALDNLRRELANTEQFTANHLGG
ncbi:MAG TPA: DUF2505 domain-containing protein [Acidimicrobiales bacterium]|nr:DUF2505 domain-containing protein [Acidimicrobiales bacterium]